MNSALKKQALRLINYRHYLKGKIRLLFADSPPKQIEKNNPLIEES